MNDFCGVTAKSHLGVPGCIAANFFLIHMLF